MKKFIALPVAAAIIWFISGIPAFAEDPAPSALDRHAVWTKWYDDQGQRVSTDKVLGTEIEKSHPSVQVSHSDMMKHRFDFVKETRYYDYQADSQGNA